MRINEVRNTARALAGFGAALAMLGAIPFDWPGVVRWAAGLGGLSIALFATYALHGLGPESETPFDWLDESEDPAPPKVRTETSVVGTALGAVVWLFAGVGSALGALFLYLWISRGDVPAHPNAAQAGAIAYRLGIVLLSAFVAPFVLLRPRFLR